MSWITETSWTKLTKHLLAGAFLLTISSTAAWAQSALSGQVKDSSGALMADVKVEASSPALIEGSRTVTTNSEGRYSILDIRPGAYTVTMSAQGFSSIRQQVDVPSSVTVTLDGELKVGAVSDTVNVDAVVSAVDIENVARPTTLTREDMDALPTSRNPQSMGSYTPGVHMNRPDVAGTQQTEQNYLLAHGNPSGRDIYLLDGMRVNTTQNDGQIQIYVDNELIQETAYQVNSVGAEVGGGGVYVNMIPKDGGNELHGHAFMGVVPGKLVGTNVTPEITARGLTGQSTTKNLQDLDASVGGPILKNKLWFLAAARKQLSLIQAAGSFYLNGDPGLENSYIYAGSMRLTYQLNSKNKISAMWTRDWKTKETDVVTGSGGLSSINPLVSSNRRDPVMYYILQSRWTGTLTPKLLVQAGMTFTKLDYNILYQNGVQKTPFTPDWYANASQVDTARATRSIAAPINTYAKYERWVWAASGAYIAGPHQLKFGMSHDSGIAFLNNIMNGDAYYNFLNGVPNTITAYNTPTYSKPRLKHDLAFYFVDTWRIKRLSLTAGLRWEYYAGQIDAATAPAGRFVGARSFDQIDCNTIKGMGCFKNWTPRIGAVYDLFGNHKTAIKAGIGKYNTPLVTGVLNNFNPMFTATQSVPWVNGGTAACQGDGRTPGCFPAGTGFGTGNIGANTNPNFGRLNAINLDPNFNREYQWQYHLAVQHEVRKGLTVNFGWNRVSNYQADLVINRAVPLSAWTPFPITNPVDGTPMTVFNLQPAFFGLAPVLQQTNSRQSARRNSYNGYETAATARLPHRIFITGGWTIEKQTDRGCDMNTSPNGSALNDPNTLRFCDQSGELYQELGKISGIPYRNEFKLQANVPLVWGVEVSASIYSSPAFSTNFGSNSALSTTGGGTLGFKQVNWTITPTSRYPSDCTNCPRDPANSAIGAIVNPGLRQGSAVLRLIAPGSRYTPRLNQVDLGFRRKFVFREKLNISAEAQIFNLTNVNTPLTESFALGSTIKPYLADGPGGSVSVIQVPRMMRLAVQVRF